jgi:glycosyltransferase involved in cell wall biosynthesis
VRIAYVADSREIGGAERYLVTLAEQMADGGHEVFIIAPQQELVSWLTRETTNAHTRRAFDDTYHDAPTPWQRGTALVAMVPRIALTLRRLAPDVVHVNNGGYPGSDLCRISLSAARLAGVRHRVMTVNSTPWPRDHLTDPRIQAVADRLVWSSVHAVACPCDAVAQRLASTRRMPRGLGRTIYYGVRSVAHEQRAALELRRRLAPSGELLVGMVAARPEAQKGYDVLLAALAKAGADARCVLVGPPPPGLAAQARAAGLRERFAIEGPRSNVGDYYAAFDVVAVPSTTAECMPLVILEAASAGTPTFASRLGGIPEAVDDGVNGRLFEPGDAHALAALIASADRDRAQMVAMGRAARERWLERFQPQTMVRETLALYG